jgi:hypothetical protein
LSAGSGSASSGGVPDGIDCAAAGSAAIAAASATVTEVQRSLIDGSSCEEAQQPL